MRYIKPITGDTEDISSLFRDSFRKSGLSNRFLRHLVEIYLEHPEFSLIAKDKDKVVGFIYAIDDLSKLSKHMNLLDRVAPWRLGYFIPAKSQYFNKPFVLVYCVDKDYRKRGIASTLLNKVLKKMRTKVGLIYCQIHLRNKPSIRIAEKEGARLIHKKGFVKKYGIFKIDLRLSPTHSK